MKRLLVILGAATCVTSFGQTAALEFTSYNNAAADGDITIGYSFDVLKPISVVGLGFFTNPNKGNDTLNERHQVGLWDGSGNLLASTIVSDSDTLSGHFKYSAISSVTLTPGKAYRVAGFTALGGDQWGYGNVSDFPGLTNIPEITNTLGIFTYAPSFTFPTSPNWPMYAGGNMQIATTPEPASMAALAIGGLAALRRRRK